MNVPVSPTMVTKCKNMHVLPKLANATTISISFDLWMSRGGIDMFALVINYLTKAWEPMLGCSR
jgi:hypothetical protein